MAHTVRDIVTDALLELGVIAAGEVATDADAQLGLSSLNDLMDQWAAERLQIYALVRTTWTIVSGTQEYTVGTGGDVNIARPIYIDHINFVDTDPDPDIEYQLSHLTEDAWSRVPIKALTSPFPTAWYYDSAYPLATLSLWPVPTDTGLQGAIYANTAVSEFASLATSVALPPGYRRMLIKSVAVDMASSFERQADPSLIMAALEAKSVVKRSNKRLMDMRVDAGALVQGRDGKFIYDINVGP